MQDIHIHICQSYPLYPVYPLLSKFNIQQNIPNYIQLWYPDYIQIYPFVSNIYISESDIFGVILFGYPEIVLYPEKISRMISNYDILVISKYIHVFQCRYPFQISLVLSRYVILLEIYCAKPLHKGVTRQLSPDHEGPSLKNMVHHDSSCRVARRRALLSASWSLRDSRFLPEACLALPVLRGALQRIWCMAVAAHTATYAHLA